MDKEWIIAAAKTLGIPTAVAGYFMLRDWFFMSESVKLLTTQVELLRQILGKLQ